MAWTLLPTLNPTMAGFRAALNAFFGGQLQTFQAEGNVMVGEISAAAAGGGIPYIFEADTTVEAPTAGRIRLNDAVQADATMLVLSLLDSSAVDRSGLLATFGASDSAPKGIARVQTASGSKWMDFQVNGVAYPGDRVELTGVVLGVSAADPFDEPDTLALVFRPTGNKGNAGANGANGANGSMAVQVVDRAANAVLTAADVDKLLRFTAPFTQTADPVATIGPNKVFHVKNAIVGTLTASAVMTFDPDGGELVDGAATLKIFPSESGSLITTAAGWVSKGLAPKGARIELGRGNAAASATIDITNHLTSDFDEYEVHLIKVVPGNDTVDLFMRTSADNGASFADAGGSYCHATMSNNNSAASGGGNNSDTEMQLNGTSIGNAANEALNAVVRIFKPSAAAYCWFKWDGGHMSSSTQPINFNGSGARMAAAAVNAIRFLFSAGTIASGEFIVYGIKK